MTNVLYIHGMGGGEDSRIPSILRSELERMACNVPQADNVRVVVRTYDFDPEKAHAQILSWVDELKPALIVGESLGAVHAIRIASVPHILVSPALNAPRVFAALAPLTLFPGVTPLLDRIYKPRDGMRQSLHFTYRTLSKYRAHFNAALQNMPSHGGRDAFFAFFGTRDHYRRSGIVSLRSWKKHFGNTYAIYDGTHFMEEEFVLSMLLPKILCMLDVQRAQL